MSSYIRPPGEIRAVPGRRARVYRFGALYHWKCGAFRNSDHGTCFGGRSRTIGRAIEEATRHIRTFHTEFYRLNVTLDGCRLCGWPQDRHIQAVSAGVIAPHGYRRPTKKQQRYRMEQAVRIR